METGTRNSSAKEGHVDVVLALLGELKINGAIATLGMALRKLRGGVVGLEFPFDLKIVDAGEGETTPIADWHEGQRAGGPVAADRWIQSLSVFRTALETALTNMVEP